MPHVFISYTQRNKTVADELCAVLERNGVKSWIAPRDIPPGCPWPEAIVAAIRDSLLMISLVSRDAYRSRQMARELENADRSNVPILPIRLDRAPLEGPFEYFLGNRQWFDLYDNPPADCEGAILAAVGALQTEANGSPPADELTESGRPDRQPVIEGRQARQRPSRNGVQAIVDEPRAVFATFVAVTMKQEKALDDLDLTEWRTRFFAFRFLIYLCLVTDIIHIPAWSAQGIAFTHPAFMLAVLAQQLIEAMALCLALYASIKIFGAQAEPQRFVSAFCLLYAFQLMADIFLMPVQARSISLQTPDVGQFIERVLAMSDQLKTADLPVLLAAGAASTALRIVFLAALFRAFRVTAQLGFAKTFMSFVLAVATCVVVAVVFSQPFEANLYKAFGSH
jgi:TIR domain